MDDTTGAIYNLELNEERLKLYVEGLTNSVRLIASNLVNGNSAAVLKEAMPKLLYINQEFIMLDCLIDKTNEQHKIDLLKLREGTSNG